MTGLRRAGRYARRRIEPYPPWLVAIRAFIALVIYGTVWLSVRGRHPYHWPTAAVIPVVVVLAVVNLVATVTVARRATTGVSGRSRLRPAEVAAWVAIWAGVFVVMGVLIGAGVSDAIVYGIYPAAMPLIVADVGIFVVLLGTAAAVAWRQRRSMVRA